MRSDLDYGEQWFREHLEIIYGGMPGFGMIFTAPELDRIDKDDKYYKEVWEILLSTFDLKQLTGTLVLQGDSTYTVDLLRTTKARAAKDWSIEGMMHWRSPEIANFCVAFSNKNLNREYLERGWARARAAYPDSVSPRIIDRQTIDSQRFVNPCCLIGPDGQLVVPFNNSYIGDIAKAKGFDVVMLEKVGDEENYLPGWVEPRMKIYTGRE